MATDKTCDNCAHYRSNAGLVSEGLSPFGPDDDPGTPGGCVESARFVNFTYVWHLACEQWEEYSDGR
jgi:hypothetical protein